MRGFFNVDGYWRLLVACGDPDNELSGLGEGRSGIVRIIHGRLGQPSLPRSTTS